MSLENVKAKLSEVHVDRSLNPRVDYGKGASIERLAESIKRVGLLHPPTLVNIPKGMKGVPAGTKYVLVAGFRRFDALGMLKTVETDFRFDPVASLEDGLAANIAENIGRKNVSRFEIAAGFDKMHRQFGWSAEKIAERVKGDASESASESGTQPMSKENIGNYLRLMADLCPRAKDDWSKNHPKASIRNLLQIVTQKDHALQEKEWLVMSGQASLNGEAAGIPAPTGDEKSGKGGSKARPSREAVLKQCVELGDELEDAPKPLRGWIGGAIEALKWAAGEDDAMSPMDSYEDLTHLDSDKKTS